MPTQKMNEVDRLMAKIERIRNRCDHVFEITPQVQPLETPVQGVFFGINEEKGYVLIIGIRCVKCSIKKSVHCYEQCARCLGKMIKGEMKYRKNFFGNEYGCYWARLYFCEKCGFTIVCDEMDECVREQIATSIDGVVSRKWDQ